MNQRQLNKYRKNRKLGLTAIVAYNFAMNGNGGDVLGRFPIFNYYWRNGKLRCVSIKIIKIPG